MTLPKRIRDMHTMFGRRDDQTCGQCALLLRRKSGSGARTYLKCTLNRQSAGAATDWRAGWPACGKFFAPARKPA